MITELLCPIEGADLSQGERLMSDWPPALFSILYDVFIMPFAEAQYLQIAEKIDGFSGGSNSSTGRFPAFKMAIPIIAVFGNKPGKSPDS